MKIKKAMDIEITCSETGCLESQFGRQCQFYFGGEDEACALFGKELIHLTPDFMPRRCEECLEVFGVKP